MDKTIEEIIQGLTYFNKKFPRTQLEQAIQRKDEITPFLLSALDELNEDFNIAVENPDYMLHTYAMYLLAQFKEKRAFEKLVKLVTHPAKDVDDVIGHLLAEEYGSILYSTYDGNADVLKPVIEDPSLYKYARKMALRVYAKLCADDLINKDEFIVYLKDLVQASVGADDYVLGTVIVEVVIAFHLFEMIDDVRLIYNTGNVEIGTIGGYDDFIDYIYDYGRDRTYVKYIDDVIKEMGWWACFEKEDDSKNKKKKDIEIDQMLKEMMKEEDNSHKQTVTQIKVGRNDKCPCGSGKKYKKCCMDKVTENEQETLVEDEDAKKWLKGYPVTKAKEEGQVAITDMFDEEAIEIDKLVYLALHHRAISIFVRRDMDEEYKNKIIYLSKALDLFLAKCKKENITSFEMYDKQHMIHYYSEEWLDQFENILLEYHGAEVPEETLSIVKETLNQFGRSISLD